MNAQDDQCTTESAPPPHPAALRPPCLDGSGDKRRLLCLLLTRLTEFSACVEPVGVEGVVVEEER